MLSSQERCSTSMLVEEREETGLEMHLLSKQFLSKSDLIRLMKAIHAYWEADSSAQHLCMTKKKKRKEMPSAGRFPGSN